MLPWQILVISKHWETTQHFSLRFGILPSKIIPWVEFSLALDGTLYLKTPGVPQLSIDYWDH